MSELSVRQYLHNDGSGLTWGYDKREADKVIAELEESHKKEVGQLLIKITELKSEIERLEILCATYRHDCDNLAISNEQAKRAARTLLKKMNYNKYKRCLAMAERCRLEQERIELIENQDITDDDFSKLVKGFYKKWHKRWLAIAEKFKEAK